MKLFGDKREYFSSLLAMICSVLWSFVFFSLFEILFKEWLLPAVIDFFPSSHAYLKAEFGADYAYILRVYYFSYVNSFFSLLLGVKFGFKGSKKRKAHFRGFTDGIVSLKDAFAHHYKSYGILDVLSAFVATGFFYALKKNGVADFRVGDFWGIKERDEFWNPNGVSCIFVRTERGLALLKEMEKRGFKLFETDYEKATVNNMSSLHNKAEKYIVLVALVNLLILLFLSVFIFPLQGLSLLINQEIYEISSKMYHWIDFLLKQTPHFSHQFRCEADAMSLLLYAIQQKN